MALILRINHTAKSRQESFAGIHIDQIHPHILLEGVVDPRCLFPAQQPSIDKNAGQLIADGTVNQGGHDCRVNPSGESADDLACPYLILDPLYALDNKAARGPSTTTATDLIEKVLQNILTLGCMSYLRMELQADDPPIVAHSGNRGVVSISQ